MITDGHMSIVKGKCALFANNISVLLFLWCAVHLLAHATLPLAYAEAALGLWVTRASSPK